MECRVHIKVQNVSRFALTYLFELLDGFRKYMNFKFKAFDLEYFLVFRSLGYGCERTVSIDGFVLTVDILRHCSAH